MRSRRKRRRGEEFGAFKKECTIKQDVHEKEKSADEYGKHNVRRYWM